MVFKYVQRYFIVLHVPDVCTRVHEYQGTRVRIDIIQLSTAAKSATLPAAPVLTGGAMALKALSASSSDGIVSRSLARGLPRSRKREAGSALVPTYLCRLSCVAGCDINSSAAATWCAGPGRID